MVGDELDLDFTLTSVMVLHLDILLAVHYSTTRYLSPLYYSVLITLYYSVVITPISDISTKMRLWRNIFTIPNSLRHSYSHVSTRLFLRSGSYASMSIDNPKPSPNYFLLKSEPNEFSIHDLQQRPGSVEEWTGVRNYEARNILRTMQLGDRAFFYHSSCPKPAIVGIVTISRTAIPDDVTTTTTSFQSTPPILKSTSSTPWVSVQVRLESIFPNPVLLKELRQIAKSNSVLANMALLKKSRLSVSRVTPDEWSIIEQLVDRKTLGNDILQNYEVEREDKE
jgi:predicted RNA-binding protein with PUA-like domain